MTPIPPEIAAQARSRIAALGVGHTLPDRLEDALNTILGELLTAAAPSELIASLSHERDRAMFLMELLDERLRGIAEQIDEAAKP